MNFLHRRHFLPKANRVILTLLGLLVVSPSLTAAEISGDMSDADIKRAAAIVSWGSVHRAWTAPNVSSGESLGLSLGLESSFVPRKDLNDLGDRAGIAPSIIPVPRLWASWDLPSNFKISGSVGPGMLYNGVTTLGLGLQWNFFRADTIYASALLHYTYSDAFGDLRSHTPGMSVQISKDLNFWQPYAGLGFISSNVTIIPERTKAGTDVGPYTEAATHLYAGARIDFGAEMSFQIDLTGQKVNFALIISQSF